MLFDFENDARAITPGRVLDLYSDEQIYRFYFPEFALTDVHSPFRVDKNPSFGFYQSKAANSAILWKDSSVGTKGNVFQFVQTWYKVKKGKTLDLQQTYRQIMDDLAKGNVPMNMERRERQVFSRSSGPRRKVTRLEVVQTIEKEIPDVFMPYWENILISRNITDAYFTGFATEVWMYKTIDGIEKHHLWGRSTPENPIFYYHFPESGHVKCYRPFEQNRIRKWISTANNDTDIQGLKQADIERRRPRLLVITKSMKEVMFCRALGVDAIAFHGENHLVSEEFMKYLRTFCGMVICIYDNDFPGIRGALKMHALHGVPFYFLPTCYGFKDPTDMMRKDKHRLFILIDLLNEILKDGYPDRYTGIGPQSAGYLRAA